MKTPARKRAPEEIRQRIVETKLVSARELKRNPLNFRTHPGDQRRDVNELLTKIGQVVPLIGRYLPDGGIVLLDGHLRADIADDKLVSVAITDLNDEEAAIVLAMLDYTASQATISPELVALISAKVKESSLLPPVIWEGWTVAMNEAIKANAAREMNPPTQFPQIDESIATNCECPKCGYKWSES